MIHCALQQLLDASDGHRKRFKSLFTVRVMLTAMLLADGYDINRHKPLLWVWLRCEVLRRYNRAESQFPTR